MICANSVPGKLNDFDVIKLYMDAIQQDDGLSRIKKFLIKSQRITAFLLLLLSAQRFYSYFQKKIFRGESPSVFVESPTPAP
jgi:hypothetical protein